MWAFPWHNQPVSPKGYGAGRLCPVIWSRRVHPPICPPRVPLFWAPFWRSIFPSYIYIYSLYIYIYYIHIHNIYIYIIIYIEYIQKLSAIHIPSIWLLFTHWNGSFMEFPWMGLNGGDPQEPNGKSLGSCGGFSEYFGRGAGDDLGPCPGFVVFKVKI